MELLEKRFGTVAVENDMITKDQLQEAIQIQLEENLNGKKHRLVGNILQDAGYITDDQVNRILIHLEGRQNI